MDRSKKIDIKQQELKQTKVRVTKALAERLEMR